MESHHSSEKQIPQLDASKEESAKEVEKTLIGDIPDGLPAKKTVSKAEDAAEDGTAEPEPEPPFSIFSRSEKTFVIIMASLAALFSPLSANIYYPALTVLAKDLNVSDTLTNLTITSYLVCPFPPP